MNIIFHFIDKYKNSKNPLILLLKFFYSISYDWVLSVIDIIAGILIPLLWNKISLLKSILLFAFLIVIHFYFEIVRKYRQKEYAYRRLSDDILNSCTILTNAISDQIIDSSNYCSLFQFSAQAVCSEIYTCLQRYFGCEFRISVIQQYSQNGTKTTCKMIGRKSKNTLNNNKHKVHTVKRKETNYYYIDILLENDDGIIILPTGNDIEQKFKYAKKNHSKVQQYLAMPVFAFSEKIAFILQVDCMEKNKLGKNNYEIMSFANRLLLPYISILVSSYQQERSLTEKN